MVILYACIYNTIYMEDSYLQKLQPGLQGDRVKQYITLLGRGSQADRKECVKE